MKKCSSCGTEVDRGYTEFECPSCGKEKVVRCDSCREIGVEYVCSKCDFSGP